MNKKISAYKLALITMIVMAAFIFLGNSYFIKKGMVSLSKESFSREAETRTIQLQSEMKNYISQRVATLRDFSHLETFKFGVLQPDMHGEQVLSVLSELKVVNKAYPIYLVDFEGELLFGASSYKNNAITAGPLNEVLQGKSLNGVEVIKDSGRQVMRVSVPVLHNNTVEGALVVDLPMIELYEKFKAFVGPAEGLEIYHENSLLSLLGAQLTDESGHKIKLQDGFWCRFHFDNSPFLIMQNEVLYQSFLVIGIIITSAVFLGFFVMNSYFFNPLESFKNEVKQLQQNNNSDFKANFAVNEIDQLRKEFDVLYTSLKNRGAELELVNREMDELVDLRTRELARKIEELETVSHHRMKFLATMSEEIFPPLQRIKAYVDLSKENQIHARQLNYLSVIEDSSTKIMKLINDVLDYSDINNGKAGLRLGVFNFNEMLEAINTLYKSVGERKKVDVKFSYLPTSLVWVCGDKERLKQVLVNLMSNALKFTDAGSVNLSVSHSLDVDKLNLRIKVTDTGVGLSEQEQERLFLPLDHGVSEITAGTQLGLGLDICRNNLRIMGSDLRILSTKGQGSCFYFDLSLARVVESLKSEQAEFDFCNLGYVPRILVLDESQVAIDLVRHCFEGMAVDCLAYTSVKKGLGLIEDESVNIILMDSELRDSKGVLVSQCLRNQGIKVPILAFVDNTASDEIEKCYRAGMDDYIIKPFEKQKLYEKVHYWLKSYAEKNKQPYRG